MPKDKLPSRLPSRGSASAFETAAHFSDVPRTYTLKQAILIYKDEQSDCAASIHQVAGTPPGLLPGQPVTIAALEALFLTSNEPYTALSMQPGFDRHSNR